MTIVADIAAPTQAVEVTGGRAAQQKTNKDIMRCLKRAIAREIYRAIITDAAHPQERP